MMWYNEKLVLLRGSVYFTDGRDVNILVGRWTVVIDYKITPMLDPSLFSCPLQCNFAALPIMW